MLRHKQCALLFGDGSSFQSTKPTCVLLQLLRLFKSITEAYPELNIILRYHVVKLDYLFPSATHEIMLNTNNTTF